MSETLETNTVVIGSGPGGYVCAIRLAQLGVPTLLVERGSLGGVCLNVGCIPSKALISASKLVQQIREAETMGIEVGDVSIDLKKMISWKSSIVNRLTGGVKHLVEGNGGGIVRGSASFVDANTLAVEDGKKRTLIKFQHAVIATGSVPAHIPGFEFDGENVVSSTEAMALDGLPKRMVVIGGGYIGMELGGVYQRLGTEVTVVEYLDGILPGFEKDLARIVSKRFKASGGKVLAKTRALGWKKKRGGGLTVEVEARKDGSKSTIDTDIILLTVGRWPNTDTLNCSAAGVPITEKGFIEVDGEQRTAVPHVFAIGDVAGEPMLAHKASKEGEVAAEVIAGHPAAFDLRAIPAVVFTDPEIATVGLTAAEAKAAGYQVVTGKFAFAANGRALSLGDTDGFVRVVLDKESELLLGVEAAGPEVSNLIAEAGLALEMGALADDLGWTIHAHPTLSEVVMEAANAALGKAVHALNRS